MDTLRALFGSALDRFGDRTAVRVGEATTSYQELVAAADRLAHVLLGLGVRPGDPVALMMSNRIEWLVADQAILRGTGARGLRAIMEEVLLPVMYDIPSRDDVAKVVVTAQTVKDNVNPTIVPRQPQRRERRDRSA